MKKSTLLLFVLALAFSACKPETEPTTNNGGPTSDNTESVVKKYLVRELQNDDPEKIRLAIDWNDDCTQILHVRYGLGYGSIVDYDFEYFGNDSIRIIPSLPQDSYPIWCFFYDSIMIHLFENRIDSICCYAYGELKDVEHYFYNDNGKLIQRSYYNNLSNDIFRWKGDNVVEYDILEYDSPVAFDTFTSFIHPQYTLPFYLSNEVAFEVRLPLFSPLWKNQPVKPGCIEYCADEDGYLTKMKFENIYSDSLENFITYYYRTPKQ